MVDKPTMADRLRRRLRRGMAMVRRKERVPPVEEGLLPSGDRDRPKGDSDGPSDDRDRPAEDR